MSNIVPFRFESYSIRVVTSTKGEIWFVGKDIAAALGYADEADAISKHCKRSKPLKDITSGVLPEGLPGNAKLIQEPDMYRLIMRSKLPSAEKFEAWVFEEVLPSIRKTGSYSISQARAQLARDTARLEYQPMTDALKEEREKIGKETEWFHYANEADLINRIVLGVSSAAFRLQHGIKKEESIRDYLTESQISGVMALQRANAVFVQMGMGFKARKEQLNFLFNRNHRHALTG